MSPLARPQKIRRLVCIGMLLQLLVVNAEALTISADQQLAYADQLYQNSQFRRAAEEYQRFTFFFADDPRQAAVLYKAGEAFFQDQDMTAALQIFQGLAQQIPLLPESIKAYFMTAECYLKMDVPTQALVQLHTLISRSDSKEIRDRAYFRMGWIQIELTDWAAAKRAFAHVSPDTL